MPIEMTCPACNAAFRLDESLAGASVRCQQCNCIFVVQSEAASIPNMDLHIPSPAVPMPVLARPKEIPPVPAESASSAADPPPVPAQSSTPRERAQGSLSAWLTVACLAVWLFVLAGVGGFAWYWIVDHLGAPLQTRVFPSLQAGIRNDAQVQVMQGRDPEPAVNIDVPLVLDHNDQGRESGRVANRQGAGVGTWNRDGPFQLYRVHLKQGINYILEVRGINIAPRLRILDGDKNVVADKTAVPLVDRTSVACRPQRTGDHFIWITAAEQHEGNISLSILPARPSPYLVVFDADRCYEAEHVLTEFDAIDTAGAHTQSYKAYLVDLNKGQKCQVDMMINRNLGATLAVLDPQGRAVQNGQVQTKLGQVHLTFEAEQPGLYRIHAGATGPSNYTIRIQR